VACSGDHRQVVSIETCRSHLVTVRKPLLVRDGIQGEGLPCCLIAGAETRNKQHGFELVTAIDDEAPPITVHTVSSIGSPYSVHDTIWLYTRRDTWRVL
jgi:hypothetical protein